MKKQDGRNNYGGTRRGAGRPETDRKKMLGHTNIQQTMQYAAVLAKDVHADYAKIDEMFK